MNTTDVVPFGKYRGQPVAVMMADADYCAWAMAQPGLRDRFANLFTIIVNGGVAPDAPTPEHNRLQLLFRNPDLRVAAFRSILGETTFDREISKTASGWADAQLLRQAVLAGDSAAFTVIDEEITAGRFKPSEPFEHDDRSRYKIGDLDDPWVWPDKLKDLFDNWGWDGAWGCKQDYSKTKTDEQRAEDEALRKAAVACRAAARRQVEARARQAANLKLKTMLASGEDQRLAIAFQLQILKEVRQAKVEFEIHGWDVFLHGWRERIPYIVLELKPQMGDDYPTVLRTMKVRNDRNAQNRHLCERGVGIGPRPPVYDRCALIVDRFEAEGANLDDVKWIFGQSGIEVRTLAEIRDAMLV